jgi:putative methyltransferase (TIGR04325 family)
MLPVVLKSVVAATRARLPPWLGGRGPFVGVYSSFSAVPEPSNGHNEEAWVRESLDEATMLRDTDVLRTWQTKSRELEPLVVAMLGREGVVRVVDFGGAIGFSYLVLKRRLTSSIELDYHVIDTPRICAAGRQFFVGDPAIHFHESDEFLGAFAPGGLLNIASSLQYVEDWKGKLRSLVRHRPNYALFTQLTAGEHDTFAALQRNLPGARLPHWFFSQAEVIAAMESLGYRLLYQGRCESDLNQIHHPEALRIGQYRNLLFDASQR